MGRVREALGSVTGRVATLPPRKSERQNAIIDISLSRVNGTLLQLFTARTDEPRAAIVADLIVNEELTADQRQRLDTVPAAAAAVVLGYERLQHDRPDVDAMLDSVSVGQPAVERSLDRLLSLVGPDPDQARLRELRLEIRACEHFLAADSVDPDPLSDRLRRHLPTQFHALTVEDDLPVDRLDSHVGRRYEDLFSLLLGPDLYRKTSPDRLPSRELRATMYGPSLGPGLRLPD